MNAFVELRELKAQFRVFAHRVESLRVPLVGIPTRGEELRAIGEQEPRRLSARHAQRPRCHLNAASVLGT